MDESKVIKMPMNIRLLTWIMKKAAPHVAVAALKAGKEVVNEGFDKAIAVLQEEKVIQQFIDQLAAKDKPKKPLKEIY